MSSTTSTTAGWTALQVMQDAPVIPVIVLNDVAHAVPMARALVAGGVRMLEVTLRTPQALACIDQLGLDPARVNLDGGAIALGHPLGATGARITGKAAALLKREGKQFALASQCIGGGMGIATILEAVA